MKTPVAFIIFNRPETTRIVFEKIKKYQPKQLFVIADGPRSDRPNEIELCEKTREVIKVDWDCEVTYIYSDVNLGCQKRVATGLDQVFEKVERAIILEDDCVPHMDFFRFCEDLLEKYKDDKRIAMISGTNVLKEWKSDEQSYHYSYYGGIWGWATWRRAWKYYDSEKILWNNKTKKMLKTIFPDDEQYQIRMNEYEKTYNGEIDSWDYIWSLSRLVNSGLSIVPSKNLVSNIGFSKDATHTTNVNSPLANLPTSSIDFPLKDNNLVIADNEYDRQFFEQHTNVPKEVRNLLSVWKKMLKGEKKGISRILNEKQIKNVAIFGTKEIGQLLFEDLCKEKFNVVAFIDNFKNDMINIHNIPIESQDWLRLNDDKIDAVIVSIMGEHDKEIQKLLKEILSNRIFVLTWKKTGE